MARIPYLEMLFYLGSYRVAASGLPATRRTREKSLVRISSENPLSSRSAPPRRLSSSREVRRARTDADSLSSVPRPARPPGPSPRGRVDIWTRGALQSTSHKYSYRMLGRGPS